MSDTHLRSFPPRPNLEQYKKQAKELFKTERASDPKMTLVDAQRFLACEHGFSSWAKFAAHVKALQDVGSGTWAFETAADAIVAGDVERLAFLLSRQPGLIRERSMRVHRAGLLHYAGANGVEEFRQKTPANIVVVAKTLLDAGAAVDAVADIYGGSTVLSLVASSVHPQRSGVQIPLLRLLLDRGASIDGAGAAGSPILAALRNGRGEAAHFLADAGARLDLESAAGTGRLDALRSILSEHTSNERRIAALAWASEYGHRDAAALLLDAGTDPNAAHYGQTPLHWAAIGAQPEVASLLLERGASASNLNQYGATPLGQAQWSSARDADAIRYGEVIALLAAAEGGS